VCAHTHEKTRISKSGKTRVFGIFSRPFFEFRDSDISPPSPSEGGGGKGEGGGAGRGVLGGNRVSKLRVLGVFGVRGGERGTRERTSKRMGKR